MVIEHVNPTTYHPLMVLNIPANHLENVTDDHDVPALVPHLAVGIDVNALLDLINTAITKEGANLHIEKASSLVPDGFKIESATLLIQDALELTVLVPGEVYPQLFALNLIGYFK